MAVHEDSVVYSGSDANGVELVFGEYGLNGDYTAKLVDSESALE